MYDVQVELDEDEVLANLKEQNPALGLGFDEINNTDLIFKTGSRGGETVHWVLETDSVTYNKLRNQKVFCGYLKSKITEYSRTTQCFKCQSFGHLVGECGAPTPKCRHCANKHDSRNCPNPAKMQCVNCKGACKASHAGCPH